MWLPIFYVLPLALSTLAIRVPVDGKDENVTVNEPVTADKKQDTFYITDGAAIDSYLIPPDPHRPAEVLPDVIVTPATYLLPPSPEKQIDYYAPTEAGEQTDWYPIAQVPLQSTPVNLLPPQQPDVIPIFLPNNQTFEVLDNPRTGKAYERDRLVIHIPSRQLEPPIGDAHHDYVITRPSEELELPSTEINQAFNLPTPDYPIPALKPHRKHPKKTSGYFKPAKPTLALHLTPPKPESTKYGKPTKLYPKKVGKGFQPIPIPLAEFAEQTTSDVPRAKPVKSFKPISNGETEYFIPDEKNVFLYQQAEQKRKLKGEDEIQFQHPVAAAEDTYGVNAPAEQETSETNYRHPGRNVYPAPLRQAPPRPPLIPKMSTIAPPPPGDRTEFRMHGMKGPHSYQFGFDTGKGKNRQFRYEERDNDGHVKGHYGYVDKHGKLRVVNYDADPKTGFRAEAPQETPQPSEP